MQKSQRDGNRTKKAMKGAIYLLAAFVAFLLIVNTVICNEEKWSEEEFWEVDSKGLEKKSPRADETKKRIALTYDDGPNPVYTKELLKVLEENEVKASFFLLGKNAQSYPSVVKSLAKEGHLIGNHTYSHSNLCCIGLENAMKECQKTNQVIEESCGQTPDYFRPPYGCAPSALEKNCSMIKVLWDVDPRDWECKNADLVVKRVMDHVADGDIILMHDAYASTVEATRRLIPMLKEEGYEFVTVDDLLIP